MGFGDNFCGICDGVYLGRISPCHILPFQTLACHERRLGTLQGHIQFFCTAQVQRHGDKVPLCLSAPLQDKLSVGVTHSLNKLNFS